WRSQSYPRSLHDALPISMQFGLSESQQMLKDNARKFLAGECPMDEVRRLMETDTAYDTALWAKMTEQGYTGIIFPEEYGGVGLGKVELVLLMEEAGRALVPGPFFSSVVRSEGRCGGERGLAAAARGATEGGTSDAGQTRCAPT